MRFRYDAYDAEGRAVRGTLEARNEADALGRLRGQGFLPFQLNAGEPAASRWLSMEIGGGAPGLKERARMTRQLAALLGAGVAIDRALRLLETQAPTRRARKLAQTLASEVTAGRTLSSALAEPGAGFAADELGLVKAGEHSGGLTSALEELSSMLEKRLEMRGRLVSALVYPLVLVAMAVVALVVIATVLVPNIAPIFEQSGAEMPAILWLMTGFTQLFTEHGRELAVACLAAGLLAVVLLRQPPVRKGLAAVSFKLPLTGPLLRLREQARLCRTLGALLRGGAPLQSALAAAQGAIRNPLTRAELTEAAERVTGGQKLASALSGVGVLDDAARQMIAIGEETNRLDAMLFHVAQSGEMEAAARAERLMTLMTPLLTVGLGLLVGGLIMSVMRAILSVNDLAFQ